jgi:hypothetical protein
MYKKLYITFLAVPSIWDGDEASEKRSGVEGEGGGGGESIIT